MQHIDRRKFIKLSNIFVISTNLASWLFRAYAASKSFNLDKQDKTFIKALIPAIIGVMPTEDESQTTLLVFDGLISELNPRNRQNLKIFISMMSFPFVRFLFGITRRPWEQLDASVTADYIDRLANHSFTDFRLGITGICQLMNYAWYTSPEHTYDTGYPGLPEAIAAYIKD